MRRFQLLLAPLAMTIIMASAVGVSNCRGEELIDLVNSLHQVDGASQPRLTPQEQAAVKAKLRNVDAAGEARLLELLQSPDEEERGSAALALGYRGKSPDTVLPKLFAALELEQPAKDQPANRESLLAQYMLCQAIGLFGEAALPPCREWLATDDTYRQTCVLMCIWMELGTKARPLSPRIRTLVAAPDRDVRACAIACLAKTRDESAAANAALRDRLHDPDLEVARSAAETLGELTLFPQESLAALEAHVTAPASAAKDESIDAAFLWSYSFCTAIAKYQEPGIDRLLVLTKANDFRVRASALAVLAEVAAKHPQTIPRLKAGLQDASEMVRGIALEGLDDLEAIQGETLKRVLDLARHDPHNSVRADALRSVGYLRDPLVDQLLQELMTDRDPSVRSQCEDILARRNR